MFMSVKQAAEKWELSDRRVRILCAEGKIPGAFREGRGWKIPVEAVKPTDGRFRSTESLLDMIDRNLDKWAEIDFIGSNGQKIKNADLWKAVFEAAGECNIVPEPGEHSYSNWIREEIERRKGGKTA